MSKKPAGLSTLKKRIVSLKSLRVQVKNMSEKEIPNTQEEVLAALLTVDPDNVGVVVEIDGREEAAHFQQNSASEFWDTEEIVAYLRRRKTLWMSCSSRTFDPAKWEAEIANGNIPAKTAAKFKKTGNPPKPFVAFRKPTDMSIR